MMFPPILWHTEVMCMPYYGHSFWVELKYALKNYAKKSAKIDESEALYRGFTKEDDDEFKGRL